MADGLMFRHDDRSCLQMGEYTDVGGVADIYVEYHGEEDSENSGSGSDFEMDEMINLSDADEPDIVISAERAACSDDDVQFVQEVLVPHDSGMITQIISSPVKHIHVDARARRVGAQQVAEEQVLAEQVQDVVDGSQFAISQVPGESSSAPAHIAPSGHNKGSSVAPTGRGPSAQARSSTFKPPRRTSSDAHAGTSTSGATKKRKRVHASSIPSYKYFNCSGNV
ncbi:hypothetical protein D1007_21655 [Hordeum vulgare]|nr:hypothetical protein D1007_21655 [Hordeum vulgare]